MGDAGSQKHHCPLVEWAAEEEEEDPVVESAALCCESTSVCECSAPFTPTIYLKNDKKSINLIIGMIGSSE